MVRRNNNIKLSSKKQIEIDVLCKSLIGKEIEIVQSSNNNQIGISGVLVYESHNLFWVEVDKDRIKKILKKNVVIKFDFNGKMIRVNGSLLMNDLIYRLKKLR